MTEAEGRRENYSYPSDGNQLEDVKRGGLREERRIAKTQTMCVAFPMSMDQGRRVNSIQLGCEDGVSEGLAIPPRHRLMEAHYIAGAQRVGPNTLKTCPHDRNS